MGKDKREYICTLCNEVNPTRWLCCVSWDEEPKHILKPLTPMNQGGSKPDE